MLDTLEVWDDRLSSYGAAVVSERVSAVSSMSRVMSEIGATAIEPLMPLTGELKQNAARSAKGFNGKDVEIKDMSTLYTVRFDETKQQDVYVVVDKLKTIDDVEFAEPNYLVYTTATGDGDLYKKDPLYNNNGHWGITGINIYDLWNTPKITTKRPVIAILDTGIDITHPDLAANIWTNKLENEGAEGRDDDANGFKDDIHGWDFVNNSPRIRDNNGHGVGLFIHEDPRFSPMGETMMQPGMVMTVEPGIYVPGFGGVRIEDMIVVTEDGYRNLAHSPKELIEVPVE